MVIDGVQKNPKKITDWILGQFGKRRSQARAKHRDIVLAGREVPRIWENLESQVFLGSERFVERLQRKAEKQGDLREIPRAQRRRAAKPLDCYEKRYQEPKQAMVVAFQTGDFTLKTIADHFGVHYSTVSRAISKSVRN